MTPRPLSGLRVLMTADTVGGVWTYALQLAGALESWGGEVALATMGRVPGAEQRRAAGRLPNVKLFESRFLLEWMRDPWAEVDRAAGWLLDLEAEVRPDVVHLNGYCHAHLPWRAPTLVVGHSCVLSWWETVHGTPAPPEYAEYRRRVTRGLRAARTVVAPSTAMLASLERHYGPFASALVIPNGCRERQPARRRGPFVLSAGRLWDEAKNLDALDRAAARIGWPVCVAGSAVHPDGWSATGRRVRLLGELPPRALTRLMSRAGIYALPARYEPFGLSALEAAAGGCALVLGDIPSLREIWGGGALFAPPDDAAALAGALRSLIEDAGRRRTLAARATARAAAFSLERMAASYLGVYGGLTGLRLSPAVPERSRPAPLLLQQLGAPGGAPCAS